MERASATEWAKRVERWKDSGLTAKEFAAQTGLKASMLSYWQWKLRALDGAGRDPSKQTAKPSSGRRSVGGGTTRVPDVAEPMQFVELPAAVVPSSTPWLELVLGGSTRVRVPVGFDEVTLTRVLRAVEASR
jgi:transposase